MKRYTTKNTGPNTCEITIFTGFHAGTTRTYWAPMDGGYVPGWLSLTWEPAQGPLSKRTYWAPMDGGYVPGWLSLTWEPAQGPLSKLMSDQVRRELDAEERDSY